VHAPTCLAGTSRKAEHQILIIAAHDQKERKKGSKG